MAVQPHALMFPLPAQGHINPMMELAKKLIHEGFFITFVNTDYTHDRIFKQGAAMESSANLRFEHIPDGLPDPSHNRFNQGPGLCGIVDTLAVLAALSGKFVKLMWRLTTSADTLPPITCIIADSFFPWVQDVADQFSIPRIVLWTTPVHANLAYQAQPLLEAKGLIPLRGKTDQLSEEVANVPGVAVMKLKDWISFFLVEESTDFMYQYFLRLCMKRAEEAAWNLGNSFEQLEQEALVAYKKEVPNFLPIGPLLPVDAISGTLGDSYVDRISLWPESGGCYDWLSQHANGSVIYISCGSVVSISQNELRDLIHGLEESGSPFIWAVRPDSYSPPLWDLHLRLETGKVANHRAMLVPWAPQLNVLTHPATGAFLSHCGWNSLTESISAGVPIIAKPANFAEQRMNAHYVTDIWRVGVRMPEAASPTDVKAVVGSLLGSSEQAVAIRSRVAELQQSALTALSPPSGSSYSNLRVFTEDMRKRTPEVRR